uniref:Uncharacterized protein n=1 Tax=Pelusios castaneus TaxID=367368 RepID=A0A8C8VF03_9SAUR
MALVLEKIANPLPLLFYLAAGFCIFFMLLKVIQLYHKRQQLLKAFESFPGPPSHWLHGHSNQLSQDDELNKMLLWAKEYPYAYPRWIGGFIAFLVVNHPDYAKTVFCNGDPKAMTAYKLLIPWIGKGILLLHGPKWFQRRRLLTPAFHYDILKSYVPLVADSVQVMLDKWEKLITLDKSVELFEHVSLMTLDSIMKCAFSFHSNYKSSLGSSPVSKVYFFHFKRVCMKLTPVRGLFFISPTSGLGRMKMELDYPMKNYGLRWTRLCLGGTIPQQVASPGFCTAWPSTPSTSRDAGKRSRRFWEIKALFNGEILPDWFHII